MGRYVGLSINKGTGGGGGSGTIVQTSAFTRSSGITTDSSNNVTKVILGDNQYTGMMYNNVGLVTGYNEKLGDNDPTGWSLTYDSKGLCTEIAKTASPFPTFATSASSTSVNEGDTVTFTVTTERIADGTTLYWDTSSDADVDTNNGSFTITSNSGTFAITLSEDTTTEGTELINARVYTDSGRTNKVATTDNITVADTSLGAALGGAVFHASSWNATESYSWTVPAGVTSISVICVGGGGAGETNHDGASGGGGGLAYKNGLAVTPGDTVNVYVGGGGFSAGWGQTNPDSGQSSYITYNGTNYAVAGGGEGAQGSAGDGWYSNSNSFPNTNSDGGGHGGSGYHQGGSRQSGGGAGGYSGGGETNSGRCGNPGYSGQYAQNGQNGGGGGAHSQNGGSQGYSCGGGGTGVYGQGSDGAKGDPNNNGSPEGTNDMCGLGGSTAYNTGLRGYACDSSNSEYACGTNLGNNYDRQGQNNSYHGQGGGTTPDGGFPGGGAGGANGGSPAGWGGNGIVRIIWGQVSGQNRSFPTTNVDRTDQYDATITEDVNGTQKQY